MTKTETIEAAFDSLAQSAGLTIPADRRPAILSEYKKLREMTALLRTMDLSPVNEPSNIYGFDPVLRGNAK